MDKIEKVKHHMMVHKKITAREAVKYYEAYRLSGIIHTLRERGWVIDTERVPNKDSGTYAIYHLIERPKEEQEHGAKTKK